MRSWRFAGFTLANFPPRLDRRTVWFLLHSWVFLVVSDITALVGGLSRAAAKSAVRDERKPAGGRDDVRPPSGNTGVEITRDVPRRPRPDDGVGVSVGWLSCTWVGQWDTVKAFTDWAAAFVGELAPVSRRWRGYDVVYVAEHDVLLGVRERECGALELHLDVPASVLENMTHDALYAFLLFVANYALNVSRCDVTLDDWMKLVTPADLDALTSGGADVYALNKELCVTRAEQSQFIRSKGPKGGDTWYLGGTSGEARLRVYDKSRESGGEVDAIRWELQLRGDRAKDAVVSLALEAHIKAGGDVGLRDAGGAELAGYMGEWAAQQLVRFVDFRDRSADSNITRCPRLRWWTALVLNAEKARPVVVAPPVTVERMHKYADTAFPSWLATLADSAAGVKGLSPEEWLSEMVDRGRERRSPRHALALLSAGVIL